MLEIVIIHKRFYLIKYRMRQFLKSYISDPLCTFLFYNYCLIHLMYNLSFTTHTPKKVI